jgi:hypothetical protein
MPLGSTPSGRWPRRPPLHFPSFTTSWTLLMTGYMAVRIFVSCFGSKPGACSSNGSRTPSPSRRYFCGMPLGSTPSGRWPRRPPLHLPSFTTSWTLSTIDCTAVRIFVSCFGSKPGACSSNGSRTPSPSRRYFCGMPLGSTPSGRWPRRPPLHYRIHSRPAYTKRGASRRLVGSCR